MIEISEGHGLDHAYVTSHEIAHGHRYVTSMRRTAGIRMVPPEEYRKFTLEGDAGGTTLPKARRVLQRQSPQYYQQLRDHISEHGVQAPILVDERNHVMDGHHRLAIADELGLHVPVGDYEDQKDYGAASFHPSVREWSDKRHQLDERRTAALPGKHWYHGSPRDLEPGTDLIPGHESHKPEGEHEHVWITDKPEVAGRYGDVYEVHTEHKPVAQGAHGEYKVPAAQIVRKIGDPKNAPVEKKGREQKIKFEVQQSPYGGSARVNATHYGREVGHVGWDETGAVQHHWVHPDYEGEQTLLDGMLDHARKKGHNPRLAVRVPEGYHRDYPETWGPEFHSYAQEKPHAAAVGQAQEHMRMEHPVWGQELGDEESASNTARFMLGKAGHPRADTADIMRHPDPEKGTSNTFRRSDGDVGAVLHPDRWDYGTMAHELAHLTHQHELGVHSGKGLSDEELHGPGFVEHYRRMADLLTRGAGDSLHDAYRRYLGGVHHAAGERLARLAAVEVDEQAHTHGPGREWRESLPPEHDAIVKTWEKHPTYLEPQERTQLRKMLKEAPEVDGPVYRGVSPKNSYGDLNKIVRQHEPGKAINFSKHVSTSTRPEVAAGFGTAVYEIHHGHGAKGIGNTLHEAVMPPGKYQVHSAEIRDMPMRAAIDGKTLSPTRRVHVVLHPLQEKTAKAWMPSKRLFGPTHGLDHRLFDGDKLRPDVRSYILDTLDTFWRPQYGARWRWWARVYFAGSEASEWTSEALEGNNDFDVLVGVEYDRARLDVPAFRGKSDQEITDELNEGFRNGLDPRTDPAWIMVDGDKTGPWSNTWYVNPHSWDIRDIRPYAAYDVTRDEWIVRPPHLPEWDISKFPEGRGLTQEIRGVIDMARGILRMPEPYRTQQGAQFWHYIHDTRSRAFGPQGEGWYDPSNVLEKALDQAGLLQGLWALMDKARKDPSTLDAPVDWSNDPGGQR